MKNTMGLLQYNYRFPFHKGFPFVYRTLVLPHFQDSYSGFKFACDKWRLFYLMVVNASKSLNDKQRWLKMIEISRSFPQ